MRIRDGLKRAGLVLGLAGVLATAGGCPNSSIRKTKDYDDSALLGIGLIGSDNPRVRRIGGAMVNHSGRIQSGPKIVISGPGENSAPARNLVEDSGEYFFVANDFEGNGRRESLVGEFTTEEPVYFVGRIHHPSAIRNNVYTTVQRENGKIVAKEMDFVGYKGAKIGCFFEPGELDEGNYITRWTNAVDGQLYGKAKAKIVVKKQR